MPRLIDVCLQLEQHVVLPEYLPVPSTLAEDETAFGIIDFLFDTERHLMFTACEDCNILSRVDAQLSNIRLPWEVKGTFR